jgi:ABC-type antimicrobial peptide transport system permease subunit
MNMAQTLWMVLADLWADRSRTLLSLLTLTLMAVGYMILAGFSESVRLFSEQAADRRDLVMVERGVLDPMNSRIDAGLVATIRDEVEGEGARISPCQFRHMRIEGQLVQLRACPLEDWQPVHHLQLAQGTWPASGEVAITEGASRSTGWMIGDRLTIYGSPFTISGLVRASGTKFLAVWMSLADSGRLFNEPDRYQVVMIQAAPAADSERLRALIEANPLVAGKFDVMFLDSLFSRYTEVVRGLRGVSQILTLAAITLVALGSYQATRLSLEERIRSVAILRVTGFSESQLHRLLQLRSLWMLTLAFLFGALFTIGLLGYANRVTPLQVQSVQLEVRLTLPVLLWGYPLSLLCAALGTWISARSLLKQTVAEAFR